MRLFVLACLIVLLSLPTQVLGTFWETDCNAAFAQQVKSKGGSKPHAQAQPQVDRSTGDIGTTDRTIIEKVEPWWKHEVIYEIYPRSFADAKNSGMGNIKGITKKLDYLQDLGVGALWITPCYPSPQVDFGYDISDFCNIAPEYGTLADFDELVKEAKKRNIRIIMDFVMNHSSDKHPWFVESRSSRTNPKHDWYIWKNPKADGGVPNNWLALFGHSAWQMDPQRKQFYYHFFYPEQPDLNWRNPQVQKAMFDVARFWLDRGCAGFRLDAINTLYEDINLTDNPVMPGTNAYGDPNMDNINNYLLLPDIHRTLKDLRRVLDTYPDHPVLLGETTAEQLDQLVSMYGDKNDEIQLPMNFRFAYTNKLDVAKFRKHIAEIDRNRLNGWPTYLYSNHDERRHYDRYGDGVNNDQITKMLAALFLTLRGTPVMYYGEEIGMANNDPVRKEDVQDPIGKIGWPFQKGRDGERTPMQWSAAQNAGFSKAKPWLPVGANYKTHNVEVESKDPNSILNFYKALLKLRKSNRALKYGEHISLNDDDQNVLAYVRKKDNDAALVVLNMTAQEQTVGINLGSAGINAEKADVLVSSDKRIQDNLQLAQIKLPPFGALVAEPVLAGAQRRVPGPLGEHPYDPRLSRWSRHVSKKTKPYASMKVNNVMIWTPIRKRPLY